MHNSAGKNVFGILVILYKCGVDNSATLQSLLSVATGIAEEATLLVWDNSPEPLSDTDQQKLQEAFPKLVFQHTPENLSLSKIYNRAISWNSANEFLVILDQDSRFDAGYFQAIKAANTLAPAIHLFVPKITFGNKVMSPGYYYYFRGAYRKNISFGVNSTRFMSIVGSGMCIRENWLLNDFEGFNERLDFYGIDTYFAVQYRERNQAFFLIDCIFHHSLSHTEAESYDTKKRRFRNHRRSLIELTKRSPFWIRGLSWLYVQWETFKFWIKYSLRKQ